MTDDDLSDELIDRSQIFTAPDDTAIQLSTKTRHNRYPGIFSTVVGLAEAAGMEAPHILSYGSSTGEEAYTLSNRYFRGSPVLGVDVDDDAIKTARRRFKRARNVRYEKSGEYLLEPESFDIIFAMSVLCRWPESATVDDLSQMFPFAAFERQVALLDAALKPGGLLVIYNASYSFLHAAASQHYDLILSSRLDTAGFVKRFARDGRHDPHSFGSDFLYRKQPEDEWVGKRGLVLRDTRLRRLGRIERDIALD